MEIDTEKGKDREEKRQRKIWRDTDPGKGSENTRGSESREKDPGRWQAQHLASGTADPKLVVPQGPFHLLS